MLDEQNARDNVVGRNSIQTHRRVHHGDERTAKIDEPPHIAGRTRKTSGCGNRHDFTHVIDRAAASASGESENEYPPHVSGSSRAGAVRA